MLFAMPNTKTKCASVRFRTQVGGVVEVTYTGLITAASYPALARETIAAITGAPSAVIRYDRALIVDDVVRGEVPARALDTPPAAVIVLPEQMEFWRSYARKLADLGLMRAVFLVCEEVVAYRWASVVAIPHRRHLGCADSDSESHR